jgi:hypothetical protein
MIVVIQQLDKHPAMRARSYATNVCSSLLGSRQQAAGSGPMPCLDGDDVVCDATIEEKSQAMFSASPLGMLGGYIIRPTRLSQAVSQYQQCSVVRLGAVSELYSTIIVCVLVATARVVTTSGNKLSRLVRNDF